MKILIKNMDAIVPEGEKDVIVNTCIAITDDTITFIGKEAEIPADFKADKVIDGTDKLAIPGLVNAHTHSYMAFMRNAADDLSFMDWLFGRIDPIEQQMTNEDTFWGAQLAMLEMIKSGTTCFNDMNLNIMQTPDAALEAGMRGVVSRGLVGHGDDEDGRRRLNEAYKEIEAYKNEELISFFLAPHAPYTCDEAFQSIVAKEAAERGLGIHMHLSESVTEIENCKKDYGCTPIELAERAGLFERPFIAAHCVQVTPTDIDIFKKYNVNVVTNPVSNMKLGNGFAPVADMLAKGVNVCLGTDGAASNNSLNMFHEMSVLALIHKGTHMSPQCVGAADVFRAATINGAKALLMGDKIGSLEVGKKADIAILNTKTASMWPRNNMLAALSYSANGSEVETVIINGKVVMENRTILTLDEERIFFETEKTMNRICRL